MLASSIITQWNFNTIRSQGSPYNNPVPTTGVGFLNSLGMTRYNNGVGANTSVTDDVLSSPGVVNSSFSEQTWRIRGNNNGWSNLAPPGTQGIELDVKTALIPILNLSLVCKEMLSGVWHWNYIALIFGSSCLYAAIALTLCVKMFNRESVMFRA